MSGILKSVILATLILPTFGFAKKDQQAFDQQRSAAQAAMQKVRRIYVLDPHWFGYPVPGHLAKGIEKSECLTLVPDPAQADAVLAPVGEKHGLARALDSGNPVSLIRCGGGGGCTISSTRTDPGAWTLLDPKTGGLISDWTMDVFPSVKKLEQAVGCR